MNFDEWYSKNEANVVDFVFTPEVHGYTKTGWDACKEEVLKVIFLNTKQNGKKSIDVEHLIKEIEKL